jgi:hypothetical protein
MNEDLIHHNRALLTRAAATRAYRPLLSEETAETVMTQRRAWLLLRRRGELRAWPIYTTTP